MSENEKKGILGGLDISVYGDKGLPKNTIIIPSEKNKSDVPKKESKVKKPVKDKVVSVEPKVRKERVVIERPLCDKYGMDDKFLSEVFGLGGKRPVSAFRKSKTYGLRVSVAERVAKHIEDKIKSFKI